MLPKIKHILYASDMGKASRPAFLQAVNEAVKHDAQITYLHVMEPMNDSTEAMIESYLSEDVLESLRADGLHTLKDKMTARLDKFIEEELAGVTLPGDGVKQHIESGQPHEVILKASRDLNADMIVMGTRTHTTLGKLLMGSTAQKVLMGSSVPVLVVPL